MNWKESEYLINSNNENLVPDKENLKTDNEGNAFAQLDIGNLYYSLSNRNGNLEKAFHWFMLSANQGNMEAQFRLGDMYALGDGTEKNEFVAYDWYLKSAIQGYPKALTRLHNLYHAEKSMYCRGQRDSKEAEWAAADFKKENNIRELYEYRVQQLESKLTCTKKYFTRLLKACREQIDDDEIENTEDAYLKLGFLYQHGYGIRKIKTRAIEFYTLAAEKGSTDAAYNLGHIFHHSPKMKWNYREAFKWYTIATENGHIYAYNDLAFLYLKGLGTDINYSKAIDLYTMAAESRNVNAMISLARIYRQGEIIEQDLKKASEWYKRAAIEGNTVAQSSLELLNVNKLLIPTETDIHLISGSQKVYSKKGLCSKLRSDISSLSSSTDLEKLKKLAMNAMRRDGYAMLEIGMKYYNGDGFAQDKDTAFKWIRNAANSGITTIQCILAKMYKVGDCVEQNYHKASIWYEKAAKKGDNDARYNLGLMYYQGLGVRKDPLEASRWYTFAAEKNNSDAQCQLGILRENGKGLRQDIPEALQWFNISVRQKNPQAIYKLAQMHENKNLEESSFKQAITLYEKAAQLGSLDAQLRLANLYGEEDGEYYDKTASFKYYEMASNQDNAEAKYKLAIMYLHGDGSSKDLIQAYHLFKESSGLGYEKSANIFSIPIDYSQTSDIDYEKVASMFTLACVNGIDSLEYNLGRIFSTDFSFIYNGYNRTIKACRISKETWYQYAAEKDVPEACYELAVIHEEEGYISLAVEYYENAIRLGNVDAAYRLSYLYLEGYGVVQDFEKAFCLLNSASEKGHDEAYNDLNTFEDIDNDDKVILVKTMLQASAESGNTISQYRLGLLELEIKYSRYYIQKAITWLDKASRGGFIKASYKLGLLLENNAETESDYQRIIGLYQTAGDKGHEKALFRLAQMHHTGDKVEIDYLKAFAFYTLAAQQGYQPAQLATNITTEFIWKENKNKLNDDLETLHLDYGSCFRMWEHIANEENFDVQYKLGVIYERNGGDLNMVQAAKWYSKSAGGSHGDALYNLGKLYETGQGVAQDYTKAIEFYEKASDLNNNQALYRLGIMYRYGKGVTSDFERAHSYYIRAAKKGNSAAQFTLGRLYEEGTLLTQNTLEALKQYSLSASQGNEEAEIWLSNHYDGVYENQLNLLSRIIKQNYGTFYRNTSLLASVNYELGRMYYYGYGTPVNYKEALKYYWKSSVLCGDSRFQELITINYENIDIALKDSYLKKLEMLEAVVDQLSVEDIYEIGLIYHFGVYSNSIDFQNNEIEVIVEPDHYKSSKYFNIITKRDLSVAGDSYTYCSFYMGMVYFVDFKHTNDSLKAKYYLSNALKGGFPNTQLFLNHINGSNAGKSDDEIIFKEAFKWHDENQNTSYTKLIFNLGWMYDEGLGTRCDYKKAINYYKAVASQSSTTEYIEFGCEYSRDDRIKPDDTKSIICHFKTSNHNQLIANYKLGNIFLNGKGVEKDYKLALFYYKYAADQNYGDAQAQIGLLYTKGYGVEQNYITAMEWNGKAISLKSLNGYYNLGNIFLYGEGVSKDYIAAFNNYKVAADLGHSDSQYSLGKIYENGYGVEQNHSAAIKWYTKAADQNHIIANYNLGSRYFYGEGVKTDYQLGLKYLTYSADQKHGDSQYLLGIFYENGYGVRQDYRTAIDWYTKAVNQGLLIANYNLGSIYFFGKGVEKNYELALQYFKVTVGQGHSNKAGYGSEQTHTAAMEWYTKAADQSYMIGNYALGNMYFFGEGVEKDYKLASQYYKIAANQGHSDSQVQLGLLFMHGQGVDQSYTKSIEWYAKAADQNHVVAKYNLGSMYFHGKGVSKDHILAFIYFEDAALLGHIDSQNELGIMYEKGYGVEEDFKMAIKWYTRAAKEGNVHSNFNLGYMYFEGKGVNVNYRLSFHFYEIAAGQGHSDAQFSLGVMYEKGDGVDKDYAEAIKWYTKASSQNHILASYNLGNIYFYGKGTARDYKLAFQCYKISADQKHGYSQAQLAKMYYKGLGIDMNHELAINLYFQVSNEINYAMGVLGEMYHSSDKAIQSFSKALVLYKNVKECTFNYSYSLRGIGLLYEHGDGVEKNYEVALDYYTKSALKENKGAYYNIGLLYYYGNGVDKNFSSARKWFNQVIEQEPVDDNTYVVVQVEMDSQSGSSVVGEERKYSTVSETVIYGEAHYYLGLMYKEEKATDTDFGKALSHFEIASSHGVKRAHKYIELYKKPTRSFKS